MPDPTEEPPPTSDDTTGRPDDLIAELVTLRKAFGATQTDIAHRMGTKPGAVSRMESGHSDPRLSTLRRYARALGLRLTVSPGRERSER